MDNQDLYFKNEASKYMFALTEVHGKIQLNLLGVDYNHFSWSYGDIRSALWRNDWKNLDFNKKGDFIREIVWIDSLENILVFVGWMFLCVIVLNPIIIICLYKVEKFKIKFNLSKEGTIKSVILWTIYALIVIFLVFL